MSCNEKLLSAESVLNKPGSSMAIIIVSCDQFGAQAGPLTFMGWVKEFWEVPINLAILVF